MNITKEQKNKYNEMANAIRFLSADAVENAKSGHPGMPMGIAEVATILFSRHLRFNPNDPDWDNRDRFILSAGHGSMLIYSLLYLLGYKKITKGGKTKIDSGFSSYIFGNASFLLIITFVEQLNNIKM